jgi:hypothetical protein
MPAGTINGIAYEIGVHDYEADFSLFEGQSRNVIFQVPWARGEAMVAALLGVPSVAGGPGGNFIRANPAQWPGGPSRLVCTRARLIGVGTPHPGTHLIAFDGGDGSGIAQIAATFEVPRVDISGTDANNQLSPQPWARWDVEGDTKIIHLNKQGWKLQGNGDNPPQNIPYRLHQEIISVTFELVPFIFTSLYRSLAKNINSAPMFGWPAGQVLFDKYRFMQQVNVDATYAQQVELKFIAQNIHWNKAPKDDDAGFDFVIGAIGGASMYTAADLSPLLIFNS